MKTRKKRKMNGVEINTRAYVATRLLLRWDYLYAVTLKTKVFGDYNHARLEVSWITSTRGLLLRGYTGFCKAQQNVETMGLKEYLRNSRNTRFLKGKWDRRLLILPEGFTDSTSLCLQKHRLRRQNASIFFGNSVPQHTESDQSKLCASTTLRCKKYSKRALRTSTPTNRHTPINRHGTSHSPGLSASSRICWWKKKINETISVTATDYL